MWLRVFGSLGLGRWGFGVGFMFECGLESGGGFQVEVEFGFWSECGFGFFG